MTDTTDNMVLEATIDNAPFQDRCRLRFINAAIAVMSEVLQFTVSATASPPSTTVAVTGNTGSILRGMTVADFFSPNAIPVATIVETVSGSANGTLTLNAAITGTISAGDVLNIAPVSHVQRAAFAAALFKGTVDLRMLAMVILANTTNRTNCLANPSIPGGNILDNDIDFQVNSTFTGIALAGW